MTSIEIVLFLVVYTHTAIFIKKKVTSTFVLKIMKMIISIKISILLSVYEYIFYIKGDFMIENFTNFHILNDDTRF